MKRLLFVLAVASFVVFGLHGVLMSAMEMPMDMDASTHMASTAPVCPLGDICPLLSAGIADATAPMTVLILLTLAALGIFALAMPPASDAYRPPHFVFANSGPPTILKTIKRE